jgi:four helix bundle protein
MAAPERPPSFENGQDIRERSFEFGCRVARFCEQLQQRGGNARVLAPQLLKCGTAIAAMLEEARAAESRADFISKCTIGLKEARESHTRLRACLRSGYGPAESAATLVNEANQIVAILTAIVLNTRRNLQRRARIPNS